MERSNVHATLERLVDRLTELEIPYAIVGALALNAYGYQRMTTGVDVLVRREGLEAFKRAHLGRGYVEKFPGSKVLRDTTENVKIDVLLTGERRASTAWESDLSGSDRPVPAWMDDPNGRFRPRGALNHSTNTVAASLAAQP